VGDPRRKLDRLDPRSRPDLIASICPVTGVSIPECSCQRCAEELVRKHAPWLLDQRSADDRRRRAA
jgi:hypothetical protein